MSAVTLIIWEQGLKATIQAAIPVIRTYTTCNHEQALGIIFVLDLLQLVVVRAKERRLEVLLVKRSLFRV